MTSVDGNARRVPRAVIHLDHLTHNYRLLQSQASGTQVWPVLKANGRRHAFHTQVPSRIATLPVGCGDGLSRNLCVRVDVLIGGRRCPQVGGIARAFSDRRFAAPSSAGKNAG